MGRERIERSVVPPQRSRLLNVDRIDRRGVKFFATRSQIGATIRDHRRHRVFRAARGIAPKSVGVVRVIMETMSEVAEGPAVPDDVVRRIAERFSPDKIILFGSRARGDACPDSDIDLLVLFPEVANPNQRAAELYASLIDFPRPLDIVVSTSSRFERYRNVVNTVYWPASREGKVLYERAA